MDYSTVRKKKKMSGANGLCVSVFPQLRSFLTDCLLYANGVHSCRAAGLNEKPLAGDQCY